MISQRLEIYNKLRELLKAKGISIEPLAFGTTNHSAYFSFSFDNVLLTRSYFPNPNGISRHVFFPKLEDAVHDALKGIDYELNATELLDGFNVLVLCDNHKFDIKFQGQAMVIIDYAYLEPDFNSQLDVWNYLASGGTVERLNLMDEADVWQLYENQLATYRFNNIKPEWQFDTEQSFYHYKRFCKAASED